MTIQHLIVYTIVGSDGQRRAFSLTVDRPRKLTRRGCLRVLRKRLLMLDVPPSRVSQAFVTHVEVCLLR